MGKSEPIYMSIPDTAKKFGISEHTLRKWCKEDKIPYIIIGIKYMIDVPQTLELLRNGKVMQQEDKKQWQI